MSYLMNVKKLYIHIFFHNLIFAYVIERLFWEQRGMTVLMVVFTEIIYATTIIILEIPTGIIADKWSRKKMMVIGAFLACVALLILIYANSFWHFATAVFLSGIGRSVKSGSENALLYDSLKQAGCEDQFKKALGRLRAYDFSAALIAALFGGFFANRFNYVFNYWLSLISTIIALIAVMSLVDTPKSISCEGKVGIKDYLVKSIKVFINSPAIFITIFTGMFLGASYIYLDEFWQIYFNRLGIPVLYFGAFGTLLSAAKLPGSLYVSFLTEKFNNKTLLNGILIIFAVSMVFIAVVPKPIGIVALFLVSLSSGVAEPIVSSYLHHRIDSEMRATIDSFQSLGLRIVTITVGLGFGYLSTKISIFWGFGFLGVLSIIYLVVFNMLTSKIAI